MQREQLIKNLLERIDDADHDRMAASFPQTKSCPTCDGEKYYILNGKRFECDCEVQRLLQRNYYASNIPSEYHDLSLDDFFGENRDEIVSIIMEYIERFNDNFHYGLGITFTGSYGTGKTFAMSCILKELTKQGRDTFFVTFDELVMAFGQTWQNGAAKHLTDVLKKTEILGLDELKTDGRNENGFLSDALQNIIRHRTSNMFPTLMTTNLTPEAQEKHFGKAFSLLSAKNELVMLSGKDSRPQVKKNNKRLAELHERRPIT